MLRLIAFAILSFAIVKATDFTGKKLEGNIILPEELTEIKDGSWLKVELADTRKQDTSSKTLAKKSMSAKELAFTQGQPIPFSLDLNGDLDETASYSVSAVLNVAWEPKEGEGEWVHKGDYLTDTNFPVTLDSCSKPEQMVCKMGQDLKLVKY